MVKIRFIELKEIDEVSKLALNLLTEKNVSDNLILKDEYNRKVWLEIALKVLSENRESIIVAEYNNKLIGYLMYKINASEPFKTKEKWCYISDFYILPEYRRKKVGSKILEYLITYISKTDNKRIRLLVWKENTQAINFYIKNGFEIIGYLMEKKLI